MSKYYHKNWFVYLIVNFFLSIGKVFNIFISWLESLFSDERGEGSSKRFVGIIAGLTLCAALIISQFKGEGFAPPSVLVNAVAALAFGALGLASIDKIWSNGPRKEAKNKANPPTAPETIIPKKYESVNFQDDDHPPME